MEEINERVMYVGGAVVGLYIDDPAADDIRPTKDIDISLEIASVQELEDLRQELINKGFYQSVEDDVICRFRFEDIKIDVMSTNAVGWAPANPWFASGFTHRESRKIDDQYISILSLPYYIATKYIAYENRGENDPRTSHDFEDITYIIDYQTDLINIILSAPCDVKSYLIAKFRLILQNNLYQEAILANLFYETQTERFEGIMSKLKAICQ